MLLAQTSSLPDRCHACTSACTGRIADALVRSNHTLVSRPPPKFYIVEFNASATEVVERLSAYLRGKAPDQLLPVATAQHLADLPLLVALFSSPWRTFHKRDAEVSA